MTIGLKRAIQFTCLVLVALSTQGIMSHKAFAAVPTPNDCSKAAVTLCDYDAGNYQPYGGRIGQPILTGYPASHNLVGGSTLNLTLGYKTQYPSSGNHVVTWANIDSNGNANSNLFTGINAASGYSTLGGCFDEVPSTASPYFQDFWWFGGTNGTSICDAEAKPFLLSANPAAHPVAADTPGCNAYSGTCSATTWGEPNAAAPRQPGASALWYQANDSGPAGPVYSHTYTLTLNLVNPPPGPPRTFCIREHVSITGNNVLGNLPASQANWDNQAKFDLPNIKGAIGDGIGSHSALCLNIHHSSPPTDLPPSVGFTADCQNIYFSTLNDPNMGASGVHFYGVIYHRNPDGSRGGIAGIVDGRSTGPMTWNFTDPSHGGANQVPLEATNDDYGWDIDVGVTNVQLNGADGPGPFFPGTPGVNNQGFGWIANYKTGACYTATCSSLRVVAPLQPGTNNVEAGKPFQVIGTFTNTSPGILPATLFREPRPGSPIGLGGTIPPGWAAGYIPNGMDSPGNVAVGGTYTVTANLTAPSDFSITGLQMYPDYWSLFAIGGACAINITTYKPFQITLHQSTTLLPANTDDPTSVQYQAWTENVGTPFAPTPQRVYAPTQAEFYSVRAAAPNVDIKNPPGGPDLITYEPSPKPGSSKDYFGTHTPAPGTYATYAIAGPNNAGDYYCTQLDMDYTQGYVGPGSHQAPYSSTNDDPKDVTGTSNRSPPPAACDSVHNEPYVKVFNSAARTDRSFDTGAGCPGGKLLSWNNNSGLNPFGAGAQLNAIASSHIKGFASAQSKLALDSPPTTLTFANDGGAVAAGTDVSEGGNFHNTPKCLSPPAPKVAATALPSNPFDLSSVPAGSSVSYTASGNVRVYASSPIPTSTNIMISVNPGNLYIGGNSGGIKYVDDGSWTYQTAPSVILSATGGNILIDPNVTQLDGVYSAQPSGGTGGTIYTCSTGIAFPFVPMLVNQLYDNCYYQLTVNGVFQANQVNLMRSMGSVRDETPLGGVYHLAGSCSNQRGQVLSSPFTCAAEVFNFSPELFLSKPSVDLPNHGALQYQSFTGLPPVL